MFESRSALASLESRSYSVWATAPAIPGFVGERPIELASIVRIAPYTDAANARLIAAAPTMLEVLQNIAHRAEQGRHEEDFESIERMAKEAIAKATGAELAKERV